MKKILMVIYLLVFAVPAFADQSQSDLAKEFVNKIGTSAINTLSQSGLSADAKEKQLERLFQDTVDIKWIGNFALGRYARNLTPEQKSSYDELFRKFLIKNYVSNFAKYRNETFAIDKVSSLNEKEFLVQTRIIRPRQRDVYSIDYKIRENNHGFMVYDIIAEGVSLITTERSEFSSILASGSIDTLLAQLREKVGN